MDWLDYREKLGIGFSDNDKGKLLSNKVATFVENSQIMSSYTDGDYYRFCLMTGTMYDDPYPLTSFLSILFQKKNITIPQTISYYIAMVNTYASVDAPTRKLLIDILGKFLKEVHVPYELFKDDDGYFVFPKGANELDNALVSEPLAWLSEYPKAHTAFIKALKEYAEASPENASDIADKFRKALETFMQEFFNTGKSLENCKAIYGTYLAEHGVPKEIAGNLETLLQAYTNYINNYAKHKDRTQVNVLEYLLYQTGNVIRLLITLKDGEE